MLQNILKLDGVKELNKINQKTVQGGRFTISNPFNCSNAPECDGGPGFDYNNEICCNIEHQ